MKVLSMMNTSEPAPSDQMAAWLAERAGKLTASRMKDALAILKNGSPAKARADLIRDLLAERLTGLSVRHFVNPAMQWGIDTEAEAKEVYTQRTGNKITPCGFFDHPMIDNFGATPDGLLAPDGGLEVKCPTTGTYVEWVTKGVVPEEHVPQMLAQCACTGRKWVEFVAYDPRIKDEKRRMFIRRFVPTHDMIHNIELAATAFLEEVDAAFDAFTSIAP